MEYWPIIFKLYGVQSLCDFWGVQFCISVTLVPGHSLIYSIVVASVCLSVKSLQYTLRILTIFVNIEIIIYFNNSTKFCM